MEAETHGKTFKKKNSLYFGPVAQIQLDSKNVLRPLYKMSYCICRIVAVM